MKKVHFDILMIVLMAALLLGLNYFELLEKYVHFALIPMLAFYWLGQYSERKFGNKKVEPHDRKTAKQDKG